jgi:hypothetical protein
MRESVNDLDGKLEIQSDSHGTRILLRFRSLHTLQAIRGTCMRFFRRVLSPEEILSV